MKFPITIKNQQEFDSMILDRLNRNEKTLTEQHEQNIASIKRKIDLLQIQANDEQTKLAEIKEAVNELNRKQKEIYKLKISYKYDLPHEVVERLQGNTYEAMDKDAQALISKMEEIKKANEPKPYVPPMPKKEFYYNQYGDGVCAYFETLNPGITKEVRKMEQKRFK